LLESEGVEVQRGPKKKKYSIVTRLEVAVLVHLGILALIPSPKWLQ